MYNGQVVKVLLAEKKLKGADLSNHLYGTPRRTLTPITKPGCNPCATLIEKMAQFFEVSTDAFFTPTEEVPSAEELLRMYAVPSPEKLQHIEDVDSLLTKKDEQIKLLQERCHALEILNETYRLERDTNK